MTTREVRNGERLCGHKTSAGDYPEIIIKDGSGPNGGALICAIQSFHWCEVADADENGTILRFENRTTLAIVNGIVLYAA